MADLLEALRRRLADVPTGRLYVGLSGGLDSSVLLHALARLPAARGRGLTAIHIDHGLQAHSAAWAAHSLAYAKALGLECHVLTARVHPAGRGVEAAAREARYAAFATLLGKDEVLALAQHRDDQSETVLLKLLRGAGPEGLAGMRPWRALGPGWLWRPLLDVPRTALQAYAHQHALHWVEDPSNADSRHARNFLRSEVLPLLRLRWPQLDDSLAHAARHVRAAAAFVDSAAQGALAQLQGVDPCTLDAQGWLNLPDALRDPVLRRWLRALGLAEPTHLHLAELERQLREAGAERVPCIAFAGTELRRYRDLLYARRGVSDPEPAWQSDWDGRPIELPAGCGRLALVGEDEATIPADAGLRLRFRRGGERLAPAGSPHTRELRDLFQSAGVPPWERGRLPLVYAGESLWAVADLWRSAEAEAWLRRHGLAVQYRPGPP